MKITNKILNEVKRLYAKGNSVNDIRIILQNRHRLEVSAEAIRRHLRKVIELRGKSDAIKIARRRHLPAKESIIALYVEKQHSAKRLARTFKSSKGTISEILRENGIDVRNKDVAVRLANTRHRRFPFSGGKNERAYLLGLIEGDLTAFRKSGHTVRIVTNTTHRIFADYVREKFKGYGYVRIFPSKNKGLGSYMWCVQADLDNSFDFLLPENRKNEIESCIENEGFFHFLAGFIDSDGSVIIRKAGKYFQCVIRTFGQNIELLSRLNGRLKSLGYNTSLLKNFQKGTVKTWKYKNDYFVLEIYKKDEVLRLLNTLPIGHPEKIAKKRLASELIINGTVFWEDVKPPVRSLQAQLDKEVIKSVNLAEKKYIATH